MKPDLTHLDYARTMRGPQASESGQPFGLFHFRTGKLGNDRLRVIACIAGKDGDPNRGWDHVSVSAWILPKKRGQPPTPRTPTWEEMDRIKRKFWDDHECVLQFHPPEDVKINTAKNCLHLWKYTLSPQLLPPPLLVGIPVSPAEPEPPNGSAVSIQPETTNQEPGTSAPAPDIDSED